MDRSEAVRKAAALLRLAARPGTVGEANAAAARAQHIMDEYEITRELIAEQEGAKVEEDEAAESFYEKPEGWLETAKWREVWRHRLASAIASANGCFTFQGRRGLGSTIEIVGPPTRVGGVRYMFLWLSGEVKRLSDEQGRGMGAVWKREFQEGAVQELQRILKAQRDATVEAARRATTNEHALMVVNRGIMRLEEQALSVKRWAYQRHGLVQRGGSRRVQIDASARQAGAAAARGINIVTCYGPGGPSQVCEVNRDTPLEFAETTSALIAEAPDLRRELADLATFLDGLVTDLDMREPGGSRPQRIRELLGRPLARRAVHEYRERLRHASA